MAANFMITVILFTGPRNTLRILELKILKLHYCETLGYF
jgi:hypothetical protein